MNATGWAGWRFLVWRCIVGQDMQPKIAPNGAWQQLQYPLVCECVREWVNVRPLYRALEQCNGARKRIEVHFINYSIFNV